MVYLFLDSLKIVKENLDKEIIFFGLGFEIIVFSVVLIILQVEVEGVKNFSIFSNYVLVVLVLEVLFSNLDLEL